MWRNLFGYNTGRIFGRAPRILDAADPRVAPGAQLDAAAAQDLRAVAFELGLAVAASVDLAAPVERGQLEHAAEAHAADVRRQDPARRAVKEAWLGLAQGRNNRV